MYLPLPILLGSMNALALFLSASADTVQAESTNTCVVAAVDKVIGAAASNFLQSDLTPASLREYGETFFGNDFGTEAEAAAAISPGTIAMCTTQLQVQQAVKVAKACNLKVSIRSGGHNYGAYSSCAGGACMQIDVGKLVLGSGKKTAWDSDTRHVGLREMGGG